MYLLHLKYTQTKQGSECNVHTVTLVMSKTINLSLDSHYDENGLASLLNKSFELAILFRELYFRIMVMYCGPRSGGGSRRPAGSMSAHSCRAVSLILDYAYLRQPQNLCTLSCKSAVVRIINLSCTLK